MTAYGSSTVKRRRSQAEIAELDAAILATIAADHPVCLDLVENAITSHIDPHVVDMHRMVEEQERAGLTALADGGWRS